MHFNFTWDFSYLPGKVHYINACNLHIWVCGCMVGFLGKVQDVGASGDFIFEANLFSSSDSAQMLALHSK